VAHATSNDPLGSFTFQSVVLPPRGPEFWDGHCTHNPTMIKVGSKFYLYYTGNRGDGRATKALNWTHRNNQRIGVAVADNPAGPWTRFDTPCIDVTPGCHDALCCANPTATQGPEGKFLMIYKGVADKKKLPFGGPVLLLVATAESPTGPFKKQPDPVMRKEGVDFAAEDPYIWWQDGRYRAIVKDFRGYYTNAGKSLALFESVDGLDWKIAEHPLVSTIQVKWEDGKVQKLNALERPTLYLENGKPRVLLCAVNSDMSRSGSFNIRIPLKGEE
jgi:hypothetical protein